jgi:hypothetical protein
MFITPSNYETNAPLVCSLKKYYIYIKPTLQKLPGTTHSEHGVFFVVSRKTIGNHLRNGLSV